jgi:hypothetical protein
MPKEYLEDPQQQNSYVYARNNPIVGSDPSGLQVSVFPGTSPFGTRKDWRSPELEKSVAGSFPGQQVDIFNWGGANNGPARSKAVVEFSSWVDKKFKDLPANEPFNVVCHSHGCNAVAEYISRSDSKHVDNLISLGVPVREDYVFNEDKIANHTNVYIGIDGIQSRGGGKHTVTGTLGRILGGIVGVSGSLIGGYIGDSVGWGEYGPAGRVVPGADHNNNAFRDSKKNSYGSHSELYKNPAIWNKYVKGYIK